MSRTKTGYAFMRPPPRRSVVFPEGILSPLFAIVPEASEDVLEISVGVRRHRSPCVGATCDKRVPLTSL